MTRRTRHAEKLSTQVVHTIHSVNRAEIRGLSTPIVDRTTRLSFTYPHLVRQVIHTLVWVWRTRVITYRSAPKVREHDRGLTPSSCEETRLP